MDQTPVPVKAQTRRGEAGSHTPGPGEEEVLGRGQREGTETPGGWGCREDTVFRAPGCQASAAAAHGHRCLPVWGAAQGLVTRWLLTGREGLFLSRTEMPTLGCPRLEARPAPLVPV